MPLNSPTCLRIRNFTILHLSDLHVDISEGAFRHLMGIVGDLKYDICVLTGDYRGKTYGPFETSLRGIEQLRAQLKGPLYGVLGNHDSIHMAPALEAMGIRMLFNECETISRGDDQIYLAGVDDAHFYRADDFERAAKRIPRSAFSILLSHTPEVYDHAASAGFDSCSADTPMEDSFASLVEFRSSWKRACRERWAPVLGIMLAWPVTLR